MPSFAHWFFAIGLAIFLWKATEGKFGIKPAFVFVFNNVYGPDIIGAFIYNYNDPVYLFIHGMGWYLVAALMAVLWYFLMNMNLENRSGSPIFSRIRIRMLEKEKRLKYWQIYLFCAAGGMMHLFIDIIGHPSYINSGIPWGVVWFGDNAFFSLEWIHSTGLFPCGQPYLPTILLLSGFMIGMFLAFAWGWHTQNFWNFTKGLLLVIGTVFVILFVSYFIPISDGENFFNAYFNYDFTYYGDPNNIPWLIWLTGGEADLGVMVYLGLFFFAPLIMLYYGFKGLPKTPPIVDTAVEQKSAPQSAVP